MVRDSLTGRLVYASHTRSVRKPPRFQDGQLALALEHHISDFKVGAKGQIIQVKHIKAGWMSLADYYDRQQIHKALVVAGPKIIEGGYRVNEAIYGLNVVGPILLGGAVAGLAFALVTGDTTTAAILAAALLLPFGAIYIFYLFADTFKGIVEGFEEWTEEFSTGLSDPPEEWNRLFRSAQITDGQRARETLIWKAGSGWGVYQNSVSGQLVFNAWRRQTVEERALHDTMSGPLPDGPEKPWTYKDAAWPSDWPLGARL